MHDPTVMNFSVQVLRQQVMAPARLSAMRMRSTATVSAEVSAFTNKTKGAADTTDYRVFFHQGGA